MTKSNEHSINQTFRDGVRRCYSRLFWAFVDLQRGESSKSQFTQSVLKISPSELSHGLEEGKLSLEKMLSILVHLNLQFQAVPAIPSKRLLAAYGYRNVIDGPQRSICIRQLCLALSAIHRRDHLDLLQFSENGRPLSPGQLKRVEQLKHEILERADQILSELRAYQECLPKDKREPIPASSFTEIFCELKSLGNLLHRALKMVDQHDWMKWSKA